jgi:hypothetical protein
MQTKQGAQLDRATLKPVAAGYSRKLDPTTGDL